MEETGPPPPGPAQIALDALWAKYKRGWRRLLSTHMLTELTLRASFDLDTLAPWRIANKIPKGTVPDCPNCTNICCAGLENVVSLRLKDIAMLMDLGRTDLMTKRKPNFPLFMLQERPALRELVASELWQALPVLKQVGDIKVCIALDENLQCSLYPSWPTTCERFPYTLSKLRRQVHWGTRCPSKQRAPEHAPRSQELFQSTIHAYNERVRDAVLIAHASKALDEIGVGAFLTKSGENPFESKPRGLPIID